MSRFLSAFQQFFELSTDAPREFGEAAGLMCISTMALGRRWIDRGSGIKPNVFCLLVAGSSRDRKSTAIGYAVDLIKDIDDQRLGPDDFTAEALTIYMGIQPSGDPGRSCLILPIKEFGTYLAAAGAYGPTASATLCKLYDGDDFTRIRSGREPVYVDRPRLNIFGACAFGMFERYADPLEWITGFFSRFLFVCADPNDRRPRYAMPPEPATYYRDVSRAILTDITNEMERNKRGLGVSQEASRLYENYLRSFRESTDQGIQASAERLRTSTMKIAMLYQIDKDDSPVISAECMAKACTFGAKCWDGFQRVYEATSGDEFSRTMKKVWSRVTAAGEGGIARSQLLRDFHLTANQFSNILNVLVQNGAIGLQDVIVPGGRGRGAKRSMCFAKVALRQHDGSLGEDVLADLPEEPPQQQPEPH